MKQTQENSYIAPDIEIVSVRVENGFATSTNRDNLPQADDEYWGEY